MKASLVTLGLWAAAIAAVGLVVYGFAEAIETTAEKTKHLQERGMVYLRMQRYEGNWKMQKYITVMEQRASSPEETPRLKWRLGGSGQVAGPRNEALGLPSTTVGMNSPPAPLCFATRGASLRYVILVR